MNKTYILVSTSSFAAGILTAGLISLLKKNKENKQTNDNPDIIECDEYFDNESDDESIGHIDNVIFDDDMSNSEISDRNEEEITQFMNYLIKHGRDINEVKSMCETISLIESELPDEYLSVRKHMLDIMDGEFDLEKTMKFDESNYHIMYSSIDPCQLFLKNGFKILSMGPDYQDDMMSLADALSDLKEDNNSEIDSVIYAIYHLFNDMQADDITPKTYEEKFKPYVNKYVNVNNHDEEVLQNE